VGVGGSGGGGGPVPLVWGGGGGVGGGGGGGQGLVSDILQELQRGSSRCPKADVEGLVWRKEAAGGGDVNGGVVGADNTETLLSQVCVCGVCGVFGGGGLLVSWVRGGLFSDVLVHESERVRV
jgi:hypothetical protein